MPIGIVHTDDEYTGEVGDSALSIQYYRNKVLEFQTVLDALDSGADAARRAVATSALDGETENALIVWLEDFEARKSTLKATAESINFGAAAWNAAGGRMPQLSLPSGLGAPIPMLALIAAIATAGTLIVWGRDALRVLDSWLQRRQLLESIDDPEKRAEVAAAAMQAASAAQIAESSPISSIANIAKWSAIAALAFLAFRALKDWNDSR